MAGVIQTQSEVVRQARVKLHNTTNLSTHMAICTKQSNREAKSHNLCNTNEEMDKKREKKQNGNYGREK